MKFEQVKNGEIELQVATLGEGPIILCVHGWPELWYSWRHQMQYFSQQGFRVAALDVRGYGGSSKPGAISAYTMRELASDVAAVARHLSDDPVILLGHDWGAPIVYATTQLYPDVVRAVAGLSVPFMPQSENSMLDMLAELYADRFFYQLYFQEEGVVEAEVEADWPTALRKIYFSLSGDAPLNDWLKHRPQSESLLQSLVDPEPFPAWMSAADLQHYVDAFARGGFRGPVNRYRAQSLDTEQLIAIRGGTITQPSCFIGGERDAVRRFIPGVDLYADPGAALEDFRGTTLIAGAGHWVQQENPQKVNQALEKFYRGSRFSRIEAGCLGLGNAKWRLGVSTQTRTGFPTKGLSRGSLLLRSWVLRIKVLNIGVVVEQHKKFRNYRRPA